MGFGGSIQAMVTSLKNNRKQLSQRERFKHTSYKKKSSGIPQKKVSKKRLQEVRDRLKKENRRIQIRRWISLGIILLLIISGMAFGLFFL